MSAIKMAIVGCGVVMKKHLKAAQYQEAKGRLELVALVDIDLAKAGFILGQSSLTAEKKKAVKIFSDLEEMIQATGANLIAITTPSGSHFSLAKKALELNANVLIEKPLTLDLKEAKELLSLAAQKDLKIAVGHIYRFFPVVKRVRADLVQGEFGKILYGDVKVRWGHDQAYYDQAAWRGTWKIDGGALMNQTVHAIDLMRWLLDADIEEVTATIAQQEHQMEAEDLGFIIFKMTEGKWCQVEGTTNTNPKRLEASCFVRAQGGEIRASYLAGKPKIKVFDAEGKNITTKYYWLYFKEVWKKEGYKGLLQLSNPHTALLGDFIEAITEDHMPEASGLSGEKAVEAVLAAYASAKAGKTIKLPLENFQIQEMEDFFAPKNT